MTNYYKKTKLYNMCKEVYGDTMPKMIDTYYRFYRGSEWLEFNLSNGLHIDLYSLKGEIITIREQIWNEETNRYKTLSSFKLLNKRKAV